MAKKKRKRRPQSRGAGTTGVGVAAPGADRGSRDRAEGTTPARATTPARPPARRVQKEEVRKARERALRRLRRQQLIRRVAVLAVLAIGVTVVVVFRQGQQKEAKQRISTADAAATRAACSKVETLPLDPSYQPSEGDAGIHIQPGESAPTYRDSPPTSGKHNPAPLPADQHVYQEPIPQDRAVHNLEHAYVIVYYRKGGPGALPNPVVRALETYAEGQNKVIVAPFPNLLTGTALDLVAWTRDQTCPAANGTGVAIAPGDAVSVTKGFVQRFRGSNNAPESSAA